MGAALGCVGAGFDRRTALRATKMRESLVGNLSFDVFL